MLQIDVCLFSCLQVLKGSPQIHLYLLAVVWLGDAVGTAPGLRLMKSDKSTLMLMWTKVAIVDDGEIGRRVVAGLLVAKVDVRLGGFM